jgi:hypothetical protein
VAVLYDFVLRLAFGLAIAMALTSPRQVTSGYYRIHSYVLLGLFVLAFMVALGQREQFHYILPLAGAVLSYAASVVWLYERARGGIVLLGLTSALALWAACHGLQASAADLPPAAVILEAMEPATAGFLLGTTIAAMFLGHWYLNTPTMQLAPLRKLILLMAVAILLRAVVSGMGLWCQWTSEPLDPFQIMFLALRWLAGIAIPLLLAWMTWKTLDIPNTQSATGILYVAVITTFTGELVSQLLSTGTTYPL